MNADVRTPSFGESLGESIRRNGRELSARWLAELITILPVEAQAIFPTNALLDHVPDLLDQIGQYVASPATAEIHANTLVLAKAREFGQLRHQQQASVHQLLREYEILGRVLETFVADETERLGLTPTPRTCLELAQRINRALYALMQTTVDTFVSEYTATVEAHTAKLRSFNQMLSHELRNPLNTLQFVMRQLAEMAESRGVALRVAASLPVMLVDAGKLELVLINLVSNAIKYSDPQKPSRFVEIDAEAGEGLVLLIVRDNGLGIPFEHRQAIFQRSFRAHAELDGDLGNEGFGMGLTIVQECLRELNGSIEVESTPGEGSRFIVSLPHPKSD
jgi:signal transduction histidine kinase